MTFIFKFKATLRIKFDCTVAFLLVTLSLAKHSFVGNKLECRRQSLDVKRDLAIKKSDMSPMDGGC